MGRQICFFMDSETENRFVEFAREIGYKVLYEAHDINGKKYTQELMEMEGARKYGIFLYFYKEEYGKIIFRDIDNSIHTLVSPVVDVILTPIRTNKKEIGKGRIWISSDIEFSGDDIKRAFIKDYERLVRWIRKNLPRQEYEKMGYKYKDYMSDGIRIYEEMGYRYSG